MRGRLQQSNCTIAVVGDVHDQWEIADNAGLEALGVDLALFVGDFGNETVAPVQTATDLRLPKAVILGNHDAHYTASKRGRNQCRDDKTRPDRVGQQLDLLGDSHVGYSKQDFAHLHLSVVGSRPFSSGGSKWRNREFYQKRYGIDGFESSAERIVDAVKTTAYPTAIFLAHNGPKGLGSNPHDICGRDWHPVGGDHGDPDLASAIAQTRQLGKHIPLVAFGHMHHRLRHTQQYQRTAAVKDEQGTVYLNAACVPRIIETPQGKRIRKFFLVSMSGNSVAQIRLVWMAPDCSILQEQIFDSKVEVIPEKLLS